MFFYTTRMFWKQEDTQRSIIQGNTFHRTRINDILYPTALPEEKFASKFSNKRAL